MRRVNILSTLNTGDIVFMDGNPFEVVAYWEKDFKILLKDSNGNNKHYDFLLIDLYITQ